MTVIAWDGKVLAADKQAAGGVNGHVAKITKIFRITGGFYEGYLFGFAGDTSTGMSMLDWLQDHDGEPDSVPPFQLDAETSTVCLLISPQGVVQIIEGNGRAYIVEDSFVAIGSGAAFAMGAMDHGAPAGLAVQIAIRWSSTCGLGVDRLILGE